MTINSKTPLSELAVIQSIVRYLFEEWGLHCVNCMLAGYETLEGGMKLHKYDDEDVAEAVHEINEILLNEVG